MITLMIGEKIDRLVHTTNRIENTWNELKQFRTIYWTIPADYAQEYVDELVFRRNCRTFNWNKLEYLILILKN